MDYSETASARFGTGRFLLSGEATMRRLLDHAAWLLICAVGRAANRHQCLHGFHDLESLGIEWVGADGTELVVCVRRDCLHAEQWDVEFHTTDHG